MTKWKKHDIFEVQDYSYNRNRAKQRKDSLGAEVYRFGT